MWHNEDYLTSLSCDIMRITWSCYKFIIFEFNTSCQWTDLITEVGLFILDSVLTHLTKFCKPKLKLHPFYCVGLLRLVNIFIHFNMNMVRDCDHIDKFLKILTYSHPLNESKFLISSRPRNPPNFKLSGNPVI